MLLLGLTLVVAFCSIVYELIYSEMLRVIFGGTVLRYSITIGLFLFSLGIGAFLYNYVDDVAPNFFRIEVLLALAGPFGLVGMILVNSAPGVEFPFKSSILLVASHLPIVVVGVLSGLEIPFLSELVETERSAFSEVLGVDYFGSLVGTVVYALVLYPTLGLVSAIFTLGLLNAVAALAFSVKFPSGSRALFAVALLVTGLYGGVLVQADAVERELTTTYVEAQIESEYPPGAASATVTDQFTTRHQDAVVYERRLDDVPGQETCLRLDMALQLCDRWVDSYHEGLVDVPMTMYPNGSKTKVLLIGGGDWIAVDHLRKYDVTVDQVDVDREFMNRTKNHSFFEQYHDDAYEYDRLDTTVGDAASYLRTTDERYDLVLVDLPGARSDEMLPLYSTEFYSQLRQHLTDDGVVVAWSYSKYAFPDHHKAYLSTVRAAGFESYVPYHSYDDLDGDSDLERAEGFYVLAPEPTRPVQFESAPVVDSQRERTAYESREWRPIPEYRGVEPNSVFDPNYDVIVDF
ncbi:spermidine synthase [Halobacteria archaeon HArc-gm2]|nr:spermidine synthase [Halobacteria archaeon HArc-gm2]